MRPDSIAAAIAAVRKRHRVFLFIAYLSLIIRFPAPCEKTIPDLYAKQRPEHCMIPGIIRPLDRGTNVNGKVTFVNV